MGFIDLRWIAVDLSVLLWSQNIVACAPTNGCAKTGFCPSLFWRNFSYCGANCSHCTHNRNKRTSYRFSPRRPRVAHLGFAKGGAWRARRARAYNGGVWERSPQRGPGAELLVGGSGRRSPLKLKHFLLLNVQWKPQICPFFKIGNAENHRYLRFLTKNRVQQAAERRDGLMWVI